MSPSPTPGTTLPWRRPSEYREITFSPESSAFSTQEWVGFVIFAVWGVVPLVFGYRRFARVDVESFLEHGARRGNNT
ncbi:hypothetical protein SAMN04487948_103301 [Halogranum amylolyticum]|uniref:Uncharacterized protein n=1 Tax=Halogranum amylolyticum TaxID=660520 RepID=A0A1H8QUH4_9EURY|nr:hypothetical protein [Halogranum amylolyticum]SEO57473.1 hypothetical protein SAMN04487948_103301 [Halogranum amylolyticum]